MLETKPLHISPDPSDRVPMNRAFIRLAVPSERMELERLQLRASLQYLAEAAGT